MKNILTEITDHFDYTKEYLAPLGTRKFDLAAQESAALFYYRSGLIRGKIIGLGLEQSMEDIIDGMNITHERVIPTDIHILDSFCDGKSSQHSRAAHYELLKFGLDYVDKWVMYNNLFAEEKTNDKS
nr:hypothetical protein [Nanoarchaeum sp.]